MLDIHRKCRREREELEARLAQVKADHERSIAVHTQAYAELSQKIAKRDEEEAQRAVEVTQLREELGHYKRVINGTIPDHAMGRHEQTRAGSCPFCQSTTAAERLAAANDRVEQLETILTLAETWRADMGDAEDVFSPSEWALATAIDALAAADSRAGQAGEEVADDWSDVDYSPGERCESAHDTGEAIVRCYRAKGHPGDHRSGILTTSPKWPNDANPGGTP